MHTLMYECLSLLIYEYVLKSVKVCYLEIISKHVFVVKSINIASHVLRVCLSSHLVKFSVLRKIFEKHEFNENDLKRKPWYSIYQVLDGQCA